EGRQDRVGPLALDDAGEVVDVERLHVGGVREVGVGHDRGRVRVGQDHPVALGTEHLAGLGARVVELARLADHDGPGADQQDRGDVGPAGHQRPRSIRAANSSNRYPASWGPGPASGWYWMPRARSDGTRKPSTTPSLRLTWVISTSGPSDPSTTA